MGFNLEEFEFKINLDSYYDFKTLNNNNKMDFTIRKGSKMPILKLEPIITKNYNDLKNAIKNAVVTFSMIDSEAGNYIVANKTGYIEIIDSNEEEHMSMGYGDVSPDFLICYEFTEYDTRKVGVYKGEFKIDFLDNCLPSLIVPISTDLYIYIVESITKTTVSQRT